MGFIVKVILYCIMHALLAKLVHKEEVGNLEDKLISRALIHLLVLRSSSPRMVSNLIENL